MKKYNKNIISVVYICSAFTLVMTKNRYVFFVAALVILIRGFSFIVNGAKSIIDTKKSKPKFNDSKIMTINIVEIVIGCILIGGTFVAYYVRHSYW